MEKKEKKKRESPKKRGLKKYDDILKGFFTFVLVVIIIAAIVFLLTKSPGLEYKGTGFAIEEVGNLTFYRTAIPVFQGNNYVADYNFYIRTHPEELEKIPFEGEVIVYSNVLINATEDFYCDGYGIISIANLAKTYKAFGINVFKNETLGCDVDNRYTFIQITEGDTTQVVQQEELSCYEIKVNNCEILPATEKLLVETIVRANEQNFTINADNVRGVI